MTDSTATAAMPLTVVFDWFENPHQWSATRKRRTFASHEAFRRWYDANWNRITILGSEPKKGGRS